jgi:arginine dihydrolase
VPSRMRHVSRQREVEPYVEWFRKRGYKVLKIALGDEYLEGGGDLIWHPDQSRIYAGHGFRSTVGGVQRFADEMTKLGIPVVPLELLDPRFYHLDTCFCPLNSKAALIYPGAFARKSLGLLSQYWQRLHEITEPEAVGFVANGIVAGRYYLTPRITPNLQQILERENLQPAIVVTSEFEKSGGSCFCMKNFIE